MLAALGAHVVDADAVYHGLIAPEDGRASALTCAIGAAFTQVVGADGVLDRRTLGAIVFKDAQARARLEGITHPAVAEAVQVQLTQWATQGVSQAIYDVPLLFEREMQARFAGIIVVWVPKAVQLARLIARDALDANAAQARLAAQLPLDVKRAQARWVIDNSTSLGATEAQVAVIYRALQAAGAPFTSAL